MRRASTRQRPRQSPARRNRKTTICPHNCPKRAPQINWTPRATDKPPVRLLRFATVRDLTGLSRTTLWRLERTGEFPKHVTMSAHAVGWVESEVVAWIGSRVRARHEPQVNGQWKLDQEESREAEV